MDLSFTMSKNSNKFIVMFLLSNSDNIQNVDRLDFKTALLDFQDFVKSEKEKMKCTINIFQSLQDNIISPNITSAAVENYLYARTKEEREIAQSFLDVNSGNISSTSNLNEIYNYRISMLMTDRSIMIITTFIIFCNIILGMMDDLLLDLKNCKYIKIINSGKFDQASSKIIFNIENLEKSNQKSIDPILYVNFYNAAIQSYESMMQNCFRNINFEASNLNDLFNF